MLSQVRANIEIDGESLPTYSNIELFQEFNAHHTLSITIPFAALESRSDIDIVNTSNKIGKTILLEVINVMTDEVLLTFRGLVIEVLYELGDNYTRYLKLICHDPSILLENGEDLRSFLDKDLKSIANIVMQPLLDQGFDINTSQCDYNNPTKYLCQYKETAFNFLNRLSVDFIQPFFYDGTTMHFGYYEVRSIEMTYGVDIDYFNISYKVLPLKFSKYTYVWNENSVLREDAPTNLDFATWMNAVM
jgi:type VI secretion system secreted protein VgrG